MTYIMEPIGFASTCFKEKFGIPRQPGKTPRAHGKITFNAPYNRREAFEGLSSFSHIILTFVAHLAIKESPSLSVRPPRLGGNKKKGVFATRSPFRPNRICSSVVKLESLDLEKGILSFSNHDILDGTPILDVKPYIPLWDVISDANNGWIDEDSSSERAAPPCKVSFAEEINISCELRELITEVLQLNPRPSYQKGEADYAFKLENKDIQIKYLNNNEVKVLRLIPL